jgi:hypothetical protein
MEFHGKFHELTERFSPGIGYRPVSQTRQTRREPLGHHVPPYQL